jgi:hypothetical protein
MLPEARMHRSPLLSLATLFSSFGMQCIMMGLLAEVLIRTYHESQGKPIYVVRDVLASSLVETEKRGAITVKSNGRRK